MKLRERTEGADERSRCCFIQKLDFYESVLFREQLS